MCKKIKIFKRIFCNFLENVSSNVEIKIMQ